ncbi:MAG: hypothetical protein ORN23_04460, partial [Chthoniobacterales bacterium]|nr:hypothetical protein [Chthoniobacterales bacterium]
GLQSTQQPSTTSTNQYHPNFSFDVSQLWGQVKVDLPFFSENKKRIPRRSRDAEVFSMETKDLQKNLN